MERKKRKRISNRDLEVKELTEARYDNLADQMTFIIDGDIFSSREDREKCYQANKTEILERWLSLKENFCYRPLCYWEFESLPERMIIAKEKWWNCSDQYPGEWEWNPIEEKDHQFLFRLNLLREEEIDWYRALEREYQGSISGLKEMGHYVGMDEIGFSEIETQDVLR